MQYENYLMAEHQINIYNAIYKVAEIRNLKVASDDKAIENLIHDIYDILEEHQNDFNFLELSYNVDDGDELYEYQQGYILFSQGGYTVHCNSEPYKVLDDNITLVVIFDVDFNKIHITPLAAGAVDEILGAAAHDHSIDLWHDFVLSL